MPAGRPKGHRRSASMRIDKKLWEEILPKMARANSTTRTELIEETMMDRAMREGFSDADASKGSDVQSD